MKGIKFRENYELIFSLKENQEPIELVVVESE